MNKGLLPLARQANVIIAKYDNGKILLRPFKKGENNVRGKKGSHILLCYFSIETDRSYMIYRKHNKVRNIKQTYVLPE